MVKTAHWVCTDAETRKRGERTGLDTPVVHAVNDAYLVLETLTFSRPKQKC